MTLPDYAGLTRDDPNPLKRWFQRRRLADALAALPADLTPATVVDYGAGDGELALRLANRFPDAQVVAFEPAPDFAAAARVRLGSRGTVVQDEADLPDYADLAVCTEVFEHLPPAETAAALDRLAALVGDGGLLLVGVPVEVGPPALAKGLFRMSRRAGGEDARAGSVWAAFLGRPVERQVVALAPGRAYMPSHIGFDHRALERTMSERFQVVGRRASPFRLAPTAVNAEVYLLARRR